MVSNVRLNAITLSPRPTYHAALSLTTMILARAMLLGTESSVTCMAVHPGGCRTELQRYQFDPNGVIGKLLMLRTAKEGAQPSIACAADPSLGKGSGAGGGYFVAPKITKNTSKLANDPAAADFLWKESERMVGKFFA